MDLGIVNGKVYMKGDFIDANLYIKNGIVHTVTSNFFACKEIYDAKGLMVLPGFIDPHVHFNLKVGPNLSEDNFYKGSVNAAIGGITTFIDFLDPISEVEQMESEFNNRLDLAKESAIDYSFHLTICNPQSDPQSFMKKSCELGMPTIKVFTTYSSSNRQTKDSYIDELLKYSREFSTRILVHAENNDMISEKKVLVVDHEKARPAISEITEVLKLAEINKYRKGLLYIVHINCGTTVKRLKEIYSNELHSSLILESAPHYFKFNSSVYSREEGYLFTMTPPLRDEEERKELSKHINSIDIIATDHCPFASEFKKRTYTQDIPMGVGGVRYSFLNMYTLFGADIIPKFTEAPAKIHGLYPKKGTLLPGSDGDVVIFDPNSITKVNDEGSIYNGETLKGRIEATISKGEIIVDKGNYVGRVKGKFLKRSLVI